MGEFGSASAVSDLARGAILAGFVVGAAYLAGAALVGRAATAVCALLMLVAAATLEAFWLGFAPAAWAGFVVPLLAIFGASAIIFFSSTITLARDNAILGGALFLVSLSLLGLTVVQIALGGELAGQVRVVLGAVLFGSALLSGVELVRGDASSRFILPGVLLVASAVFMVETGQASVLTHGLFTLGVLTASLASLLPPVIGGRAHLAVGDATALGAQQSYRAGFDAPSRNDEQALVSENQLAQVLDYSGLSVWDWCAHASHHTRSFAEKLGAEAQHAQLNPELFKSLVAEADQGLVEAEVFGAGRGDGPFDVRVRASNGAEMRLRGARAVAADGVLERVVMFMEEVDSAHQRPDLLQKAATSLTAAAATVATQGVSAVSGDALKRALDANEIVVAFQPIVSLDANKTNVGFEALLRWSHATMQGQMEDVLPSQIIAAAEASGEQERVAALLLSAAADKILDARVASRRDVFVSLNFSAKQLARPALVQQIEDVCVSRALPPKSMVVEVSESVELSSVTGFAEAMEALLKAGVALAIDDFGAGATQLRHLSRYRFDYLKIDGSMIEEASRSANGAKVLRAIAELGTSLGSKVIAEGIDGEPAAKAARLAGCTLGQGFFLGTPSIETPQVPDAGSVVIGATDRVAIDKSGESLASESGEAQSKRWTRIGKRRLFAGGELR